MGPKHPAFLNIVLAYISGAGLYQWFFGHPTDFYLYWQVYAWSIPLVLSMLIPCYHERASKNEISSNQ